MTPQEIKLTDGEIVSIKPLALKDLRAVRKLYSSLSAESKELFSPRIVRPSPPIRQLREWIPWSIARVSYFLSAFAPVRRCLAFIPQAAWITFVANNSKNEVIGLIYFCILGHRFGFKHIAEMGQVVRDDYQNRGLGTNLTRIALDNITDQIGIVVVEVNVTNLRNIHVNEKLGFKVIGNAESEEGQPTCLMAYLSKSLSATRRKDS